MFSCQAPLGSQQFMQQYRKAIAKETRCRLYQSTLVYMALYFKNRIKAVSYRCAKYKKTDSKFALMSVLCGSQTDVLEGWSIPRLIMFSDQLHLIQHVNYVRQSKAKYQTTLRSHWSKWNVTFSYLDWVRKWRKHTEFSGWNFQKPLESLHFQRLTVYHRNFKLAI